MFCFSDLIGMLTTSHLAVMKVICFGTCLANHKWFNSYESLLMA